jgi:hypothetical protein
LYGRREHLKMFVRMIQTTLGRHLCGKSRLLAFTFPGSPATCQPAATAGELFAFVRVQQGGACLRAVLQCEDHIEASCTQCPNGGRCLPLNGVSQLSSSGQRMAPPRAICLSCCFALPPDTAHSLTTSPQTTPSSAPCRSILTSRPIIHALTSPALDIKHAPRTASYPAGPRHPLPPQPSPHQV